MQVCPDSCAAVRNGSTRSRNQSKYAARMAAYCRTAKVPDEREFATKGELARHIVLRALASPLSITWVTADSAYGQDNRFRRLLEQSGAGYALVVPKSQFTVGCPRIEGLVRSGAQRGGGEDLVRRRREGTPRLSLGGIAAAALHLTAGQAGDAPAFAAVMDGIRVPRMGPGRLRTRPEVVLADRVHSSRAIRGHLRRRGIRAIILQPADQIQHRLRRGRAGGRPPSFDAEAYEERNTVEWCINWFKQWRGRAMRTDKLSLAYRAALHLAAIFMWARRGPSMVRG